MSKKMQTPELRSRYDDIENILREVLDTQFQVAWGTAFNLTNDEDRFALVSIHMRTIERHLEADTHEDVTVLVKPVAEQINGEGIIRHGWKTAVTIVGFENYLPLEISVYYSPESGITVL